MDDLRYDLIEYRRLTEEVQISLDKGDYDNLNILLSKRREIIAHICTLKYTREEFGAICEEVQLETLETKINDAALKKQRELKQSLAGINKQKAARNSYAKKYDADSIFFNKKV